MDDRPIWHKLFIERWAKRFVELSVDKGTAYAKAWARMMFPEELAILIKPEIEKLMKIRRKK